MCFCVYATEKKPSSIFADHPDHKTSAKTIVRIRVPAETETTEKKTKNKKQTNKKTNQTNKQKTMNCICTCCYNVFVFHVHSAPSASSEHS